MNDTSVPAPKTSGSPRGRVGAATISALLLLTACATTPREPFTAAEQAAASPAGFADVRYAQDAPALRALLRRALTSHDGQEVDVLALSGGGANGAYGAGLLHGWTATGERPRFQVVTGVSTGALTAPFAFLGPAWDAPLRRAYTGARVAHLLRGRGILALFSPGLYRREPLEDLVRGYVSDQMLAAVAAEHARGRRLLVATTNLDTEQLTVWDMGAIASHGGPAARGLFEQVLVASASVPGVFPPALIAVQDGPRRFGEMHVDGETASAFFAFPPALLMSTDLPNGPLRLRLHIIINGQTRPRFLVTPRATLPILGRSFEVASKSQIGAELIATAQFCRDHGCRVWMSDLPADQTDDPLDFSLAHERSLFTAGETAIAARNAWRDLAAAPAP